MKKLLTVLLTLLMVFTLVGCSSKQDTPVVQEPEKQEEVVEETKEEPEIVGGYVDVEDGTLTDELKDIFDSALEGLLSATYEPQELVATQVVAGTNYKFLANGTKTTNPITKGTYYIYVNKDLQGNVSLLDIETIEEKQEETSQTKKDILKTYKYWVVFYDQYGNELQREALKYGTVPEYKSWLPEGFDKWVYKKSGKDVGSFKSITGNTYYQAVCHEVYHSSSTPAPTPVTYTVKFDLNGIDSTAPEPQTIVSGNKVIKPENPTDTTHEFLGWFKTKDQITGDLSDEWDFDNNVVTTNITLYAKWNPPACLAKGTLITMADGTRRLIETLSEGDIIRVFNHDTGKVSSAKIMDYWQYEEKKSGLITLHFTNDIDVNIVDSHCFYNKEENKYILLRSSNIDNYVGKHFYNVDNDSWETLLSATYSNEKVDTFFIATEGQFDCVAEGMLNVEDGVYYALRNTFDFDNNMKIDEMKKANDIECYGLFDSTDFEYLTKEAFERYGAANLKVALGKGIITEEFLDTIKAESITYESENIVEEYIPENVQHSVR